MPTDVSQDTIELNIELLEAVEPNKATRPFPSLIRSGKYETREFQALTLENPYLRITTLPDLGGRILRIFDKRTGTDILPFDPELSLITGGRRGVLCPAGVQVEVGRGDRPNSMGTVSSMPDYADGDEGPTAIWWGELDGEGISLNVRIHLPPDQASFEIEVRAFNRTLAPLPYDGRLVLGLSGGNLIPSDHGFVWHEQNRALMLDSGGQMSHAALAEGRLSLHRFGFLRSLAPRQLDAWKVRISPYSGMGEFLAGTSQFALGLKDGSLSFQASQSIARAKVVIQTASGEVLDAPIDLDPAEATSLPMPESVHPLGGIVVLGSHREELLRWDSTRKLTMSQIGADEPIAHPSIHLGSDFTVLQRGTFDVEHRHLAHTLLGYQALAAKDFGEASRAFEQALLYNAEDHLVWWAKAIAERHLEGGQEERPELLNAHYLAPLEPALRAESFLANPTQSKEKVAVLNPLEETPDAFIDVACHLLEMGLNEEASKWLDESLRHVDLPMLRYLLAYAYLRASRMDVEAGELISAAGRLGFRPPYPWRPTEWTAIEALIARFPNDPTLPEYYKLLT